LKTSNPIKLCFAINRINTENTFEFLKVKVGILEKHVWQKLTGDFGHIFEKKLRNLFIYLSPVTKVPLRGQNIQNNNDKNNQYSLDSNLTIYHACFELQ